MINKIKNIVLQPLFNALVDGPSLTLRGGRALLNERRQKYSDKKQNLRGKLNLRFSAFALSKESRLLLWLASGDLLIFIWMRNNVVDMEKVYSAKKALYI